MFCFQCGANIPDNSKFCPKCGTPMIIEDDVPQQPQYMPRDAQPYDASPYTPPNPTSTGAPPYAAPPQPPLMNAEGKGKIKIWIPIIAGVVVLALIFGALSLFTEIFPWSKKDAGATAKTSSQSENDRAAGTKPEQPDESPAAPSSQTSAASASTAPTPETPTEMDEIDALKTTALAYLGALDCPIMDESDNRIGIRVRDIEKVDDGYKIYWGCDMSGNDAFIFSLMRFFDPDDYSNNYQPFTISDGSLNYTFGAGDIIGYTEFRVREFEPDCMMFYMYFGGALESMGAPPEIQTEPLFFTFVLGDEPALVEEAPRFANGIFDGYTPPAEDPDDSSGIPAEYVGQWIGYADGSYLAFSIEADGKGEYTLIQGSYTESYDFSLEIGTETFSVAIPRNNSSGISAIEGTYEFLDGMLILDIITTLNSGSVLTSTVTCVRISDNGVGSFEDMTGRDYEIQTAVYDMIVLYTGLWSDGKPNGAGIAIAMESIPGLFEFGDVLAGVWIDGLLQGPGIYTSYDGSYQLRGTFIDGLKEGTVQAYLNGVYLYDIEFVNGSPT